MRCSFLLPCSRCLKRKATRVTPSSQRTTRTKLSSICCASSQKLASESTTTASPITNTMAGLDEQRLPQATGDEVAFIKATYGQDCKVIQDIGDFTHVIDIKIPEDGLSIKFQITGKCLRENYVIGFVQNCVVSCTLLVEISQSCS